MDTSNILSRINGLLDLPPSSNSGAQPVVIVIMPDAGDIKDKSCCSREHVDTTPNASSNNSGATSSAVQENFDGAQLGGIIPGLNDDDSENLGLDTPDLISSGSGSLGSNAVAPNDFGADSMGLGTSPYDSGSDTMSGGGASLLSLMLMTLLAIVKRITDPIEKVPGGGNTNTDYSAPDGNAQGGNLVSLSPSPTPSCCHTGNAGTTGTTGNIQSGNADTNSHDNNNAITSVNSGAGAIPSVNNSPNPFSTAPQTGQLSPEEGKAMAVQVAQQLRTDFPGLSKAQAAGIAGNLCHESNGMNANVNEIGSDPSSPTYGAPNKTQFGYGWAQWTGERKTAYLDYCQQNGADPASPAANYEFLKYEMQTTESKTIPAVEAAGTPGDAATAFRKVFERATNPVDSSRINAANDIYAAMP